MTQVKSEVVWHRGHFYAVVDGVKVAKRGHPDYSPKLPLAVQLELASTWMPLVSGYHVYEDDDANVVVYDGAQVH